MDYLVELPEPRAGRKVYQYITSEGNRGRIVSKRQHLLDLKAQGKLVTLNVEEISFSSKRKRSVSFEKAAGNVVGIEVVSEIHDDAKKEDMITILDDALVSGEMDIVHSAAQDDETVRLSPVDALACQSREDGQCS